MSFKEYNQDQLFLFPPSLHDFVPWLKDREIGEIVGEFMFGTEKNPFRGNELLLPRGWE